MKKGINICLVSIILWITIPEGIAQVPMPDSVIFVYKITPHDTLRMTGFFRDDLPSEAPAMVFFFGGGWKGGNRNHLKPQAKYFAMRGLRTFVVDYRINRKHGTTPFESLMDAKSAIRYLKVHAGELKIDPERIIASGGSAGGHLAAATAMIEAYNDPDDPMEVSAVPAACVLFNPVLNNGPEGYGFDRIGDRYPEFSPAHNVRPGLPPMLILLGTQDHLIPAEQMVSFAKEMNQAGNRCELVLYERWGHGFFNTVNPAWFAQTLHQADVFLVSLGYLD